jgi:exosortase A-associated hydrolase 1
MNYTEEATLFACSGDSQLGILAKPETPTDTGVIVIVGGPQYRVGSHRQFVLLSRTLATAGYATLRFDYRGMGDSEGLQRDFQSVSADIATAINAMQQRVPAVKNVVLWGLCDGASAALLYCFETHDLRVSGLCLLNPWVRSETSLARTQVKHYYTQRLMQKEFWLKLLNGKMTLTALSGLAQNIRLSASGSGWLKTEDQPFQHSMASAWNCFSGQILLILSGEDYVAKEFLDHARNDAAWIGAMERANLQCSNLIGADHTFSSAESRKRAENLTLNWLTQQLTPTQPVADSAAV